MSFRKPGYVAFEWVEKNILSKLRDPRTDNQLLRDCEAAVNELKQSVPSLPANSLAFEEALTMFALVFDARLTTWTLVEHERYHPPASLLKIMEEYEFATQGSPFNEALARGNIINVLVSCIGQEKRYALQHAFQAPTETAPSPSPAPLSLQFETRLSYQVTYKREKRMLQGAADYSLSYDSEDPLATNLLLVETKRKSLFSTAASQLIVYMGIIHRAREEQQKRNKIVYGVTTDGNQYQFWRIDNDSVVTHSRLYEWKGGDSSEIISYLRLVIRAAILSSPSTSPAKGKVDRETSLGMFSDVGKGQDFDFGIGRLTLMESEKDDADVEILDLPDL